MRIGLLADTHIPEAEKEIPPQVIEAFKGVDLILHAGDVSNYRVLDHLEHIAPVLAALGDHDYSHPDSRWQEKHILKLEGHVLWLFHVRPYSPPSRNGLKEDASGKEEAYPNIIVFGHDHRTVVERSDGILYICPGSPTLLNRQRGLGTVGILELNSGKADVQIVQLKKSD
ncbi:metallophosphoesterase family protein [Chloroflexota bacterium]